jgi:hypothetical protein
MAERRAPYRSAAPLREIQNTGVREMIRHAYETVPHCREQMREKRLQPGRFPGGRGFGAARHGGPQFRKGKQRPVPLIQIPG